MRVVYATDGAISESHLDSHLAALAPDGWSTVTSLQALGQELRAAPDLLLYDPAFCLSLPEVRRLAPELPLVVLAGNGSPAEVMKALREGADEYVSRTIDDLPRLAPAALAATERRRRQAESDCAAHVAASTMEFRQLLDHAPLAYQSLDEEGRLQEVNQAWLELLGYQREEVLGRPFGEFVAPDQAADLAARWSCFKRSGTLKDLELELRRQDGQTVVIRHDGRVEYTADGQFVRTHCILRDVTRQCLAERAALRARRAFRVLSSCSQAVARAVDPQALLETVCGILADIGGYPAAWVIEPEYDVERHVRLLASAGRQRSYLDNLEVRWSDTEQGRGPTGTALRTGRTVVFRDCDAEARFGPWRERARQYRLRSAIALPLLEEGRPIAALTVWADSVDAFDEQEVSLLEELASDLAFGLQHLRARAQHARDAEALRASEERYRTLFDSAPVALMLFKEVFLDCNEQAERLLGMPREELIGRTAWELSPETQPDGQPSRVAGRHYGEAARAGRPQLFCWQYRRPDGVLIDAEVSLRAIDMDGQQLLLVSALDVGPLRQAERQQDLLQAQLVEAHKLEAVGRLAGGIAHDFNNLLTTINGYADFLLDDLPADSRSHGDAASIRTAGGRAALLTRQLLAFSRRQMLAPRPAEVNHLVNEFVELMRRLIPESVELVTELHAESPSVLVDATQLEQVLMNLVVNALDAMPEGGRLTIRSRLSYRQHRDGLDPPPGEYVVIEVGDTGCGMTPEVSAQVFEPFFTTKPVGQGTGLGLATVYGIVKQSGGAVELETAPGAGTTFRIYLPHYLGEAEEAGEEAPPPATRGRERVLVVEDEPTVRQLVHRTLECHGYQVMVAEDGDSAWDWLSSQPDPVDLLLTDLVLPGRSGAALAAEARGRWPRLRVLYMSGYTEHDALVGQSLLPGCRLVSKPFRPSELANHVREALDTQ